MANWWPAAQLAAGPCYRYSTPATFAQEAFALWLSATRWRTACPNLQLRWSLPHACCKLVTSLSRYYLTNTVLGCTVSPLLAVIFCFHRNILTLFSNADSHYDNNENYLGIYNSSSLPGLFRLYISRLQYSLWALLRWITAAISQNPTASKSGWGQEETSTAKENLRYQNSNKMFTLGNIYFFKVRAINPSLQNSWHLGNDRCAIIWDV